MMACFLMLLRDRINFQCCSSIENNASHLPAQIERMVAYGKREKMEIA